MSHGRWPKAKVKTRREDGFYSFISYSTRDPEAEQILRFVDGYVRALKERGVSYIPVFLDRFDTDNESIVAGRLEAHLRYALEKSDFTTAFLTPGYVSSDWCEFEWEISASLAEKRSSRILSIRWLEFEEHERSLLSPRDGPFQRWAPPVSAYPWCDLAPSLKAGEWQQAIWLAADYTLDFLDEQYG